MKDRSSSCASPPTVEGRVLRVSAMLTVGLLAGIACGTEDGSRGDVPTAVSSTGGNGPGASGGNVDTSDGSQGSTGVAPGSNTGTDSATGPTASVSNEPAPGGVTAGDDTGAGGIGGGPGNDIGSVDSVGSADAGAGSAIGGEDAPGGNDGLGGDDSVTDAGTDTFGNDGVTAGDTDSVTRTASTFTFRHFPIETNSDDVWSGAATPSDQPTSTTFDTVILENGYLQVTLLPDYGGRILSVVHKPTGRELLYQNPLGTPYLMYEDIFYYDYLVILGGIFPSFPEPEHGRYWNQPYDFEVVSESEDAVTVRMSRQDDRDVVEGVPEVYGVGRTDVVVAIDVTLRAGSTRLELDTKLTNTRNSAVPEFEYWTVTTLAPGSVPGETAIPLNTRIMASMDQVRLLESSWSWFGDAEERVADEVFTWDNLSYFENWVDQGTAFANPEYQANWSGLVNYDNDTGILRVSDNTETPGLKLWTFGRGSLDIDINDSDEWLRPTIEMWHGVTPEFWERGMMSANEVRQWSESYFPTLGLKEITSASEYGAMHLSGVQDGEETVLTATATLTLPEQTVTAVFRLDGNVVLEQEVVVPTTDATTVNVTVPSSAASPGAVFEAEFSQSDSNLLTGQIAL